MEDCIFCKIVRKEVPAEIVYEDEHVVAFKDIKPVAPVHILVIPRKHIPDLTAITEDDVELMGRLHQAVVKVAEKMGVAEKGFRLVNNCKEEGGQVIYHLHFHLIGGRKFKER
ncbi:histidine triad nucleotide-binding protein [Calderihabitans maritimus]|uniref:Histidine triad protein n=1 Tax=Calderihabitans maritimus TaxID=1246530 RepID=A0A1Z5HV87_9FIRM|nr:histidine triad protein [Calderihabitans maritimus]